MMLSEALELITLQNRVQAVERFEKPFIEVDQLSKEDNSSAPLEDLLNCKDSRSVSLEDLLNCKDSRSVSLEDLVATNPLIVDHIDHHGRRCGVSQRDEFDAMLLSEMCKGFYSSSKNYNRKIS